MRNIHQEIQENGYPVIEFINETPKLLVEKFGAKNSNLRIPNLANFEINFQTQFLIKLNPSPQKVAVLISNEFEGFAQNGGIGTYSGLRS